MKLNQWLSEKLFDVADALEANIAGAHAVNLKEDKNVASREAVHSALEGLFALLFPGCFSGDPVQSCDLDRYVRERLKTSAIDLYELTRKAFLNYCRKTNCSDCDCESRADDAAESTLAALPRIRELLLLDIEAAYDGDPAAQSYDEIVLSYPFIEAIATHRIAHELYKKGVPLIPRMMSEWSHSRTGIDIHPGASIGERFFIDHGTGVVIGETATIGNRVKIYQGVTLGALSFPLDEAGHPIKGIQRHPTIEDDVIIYAGATILGGKTVIGKGSVIGGNVWLTHSVPPGSKIYYKQ